MCAVCATTPALVYGAATTKLNLPGITGAISRKKLLIFVADYIRLFEEVLPKAVQEADGETFYWHSSPSSGGCFDNPDDANRGDTHYWDVWHGQKPFTDYRKIFFRFCSNSVFSLSHVQRPSTVLLWKMTAIFSPVSWKAIRKMMRQTVRCSTICPKICAIQKDLTHLLYASQVLQGMAIKYGVNHWRRNRGRCMGTLYWQINDDLAGTFLVQH